MDKIFKTKTYGDMRLQIDTGKGKFITKGIEVKAKVDLDNGSVSFFIEPENLKKLKEFDSDCN